MKNNVVYEAVFFCITDESGECAIQDNTVYSTREAAQAACDRFAHRDIQWGQWADGQCHSVAPTGFRVREYAVE